MNDATTPGSPGPTVYLLTLAGWDCYADDYEWGGSITAAEIDLNTAFAGSKGPSTPEQALEFSENCVSQLEGFPADARRLAHQLAVTAVSDYPEAVTALDPLL